MEIKYSINDFSKENHLENGINYYVLNKEFILFNKLYEEQLFYIYVKNEYILTKYINKLNEYINWLGSNCKEYVINCYDKMIENNNGYGGLEWYTTFYCISININLEENGEIYTSIDGNDFPGNSWMHNEMKFKEKELILIKK